MIYDIEYNNKYSLMHSNIKNLQYNNTFFNSGTNNNRKKESYDSGKKILKYNVVEQEPELLSGNEYGSGSYNLDNNSLLWIIYIMLYSYEEYCLIDTKNLFSKEQEFRYKLIELLQIISKKQADRIKVEKINVKDIINELGNNEEISLKSFKQINFIFKQNICICKSYIACIHNYNDSKSFWVCNINKKELMKPNDKYTMEYLQTNYHLVDNIEKPFKSESYYKADELRSMCSKLNIPVKNENNKNKTKKELYRELMNKIEL